MSPASDLEHSTSHFADAGGVRVHYHELGEGPALFLLQGSGPGATGWSNFSRNVEALSRRFRVIVPDVPGFGRSDLKPVDAPVPGWWAQVVRDLMDALGVEKAHFVGNSMGGMITLKIALETPERVDRMILMGPGGGQPLFTTWPTAPIMNLVTFYDGPGPSPERVRAFVSACLYDQSLITDELIAARTKAALDPRIAAQPPMRMGPGGPPEDLWRDPRMARLPHETLIAWGREDRVLPWDLGLTLARQIPAPAFTSCPSAAIGSCGSAPTSSTPWPWASWRPSPHDSAHGCAPLSLERRRRRRLPISARWGAPCPGWLDDASLPKTDRTLSDLKENTL